MIKKEKGIALVSLLIVIGVMTIVASTVVYVSLDRFEINNLRKMYNDIELLQDKVSSYYLRYEVLPVLRDNTNTVIQYPVEKLNFTRSSQDNEIYFILDLEAMEGLALNYGEKGFKNPNTSDDVYIINDQSNIIYYVKGIEMDGQIYHYLNNDVISLIDNVPPTNPEIKVISGEYYESYYITAVYIEIVPGRDNSSGIKETTCSITKDGTKMTQQQIESLKQENSLYKISENGTYVIKVKSIDNSNNESNEVTKTIQIKISEEHEHVWNSGTITKAATCTATGTNTYTCTACEETKTETILALGHSLDSGTTTSATCTVAKKVTYKCTRSGCTYTKEEQTGTALGHYLKTNINTKICTEGGEEITYCARTGCDYEYTTTYEAGHEWWVTDGGLLMVRDLDETTAENKIAELGLGNLGLENCVNSSYHTIQWTCKRCELKSKIWNEYHFDDFNNSSTTDMCVCGFYISDNLTGFSEVDNSQEAYNELWSKLGSGLNSSDACFHNNGQTAELPTCSCGK